MARRSQRRLTHHRILVVDDQEEMLLSVRNLLEREGHFVLTADSGERALELFKENEIHLMLVDYFMPQMTGEELIREVRNFDPYVQIILQTGYAGEKPASQMMADLDIQGYHDKSEGPEKLLLWVDVGLKAHRLISCLRDRERLQSELVANVSHEFRTPLHIISGYTDLLLQGEFGQIPEEAHEALRRVAGATVNLSELVSDLLRYGKLEAGVSDGSCQWIVTEELASELERLATLLLEERNVRFELDLDGAPEGFSTDAVKLRTILRNLVTNAVKFTPAGTVSLRVAAENGDLCFSVRDTGVGIAPEDHDLVFEPFRQLDGSSSRQFRGIGLGLALSRKLARILGGDVRLESRPGTGSAFTLHLPAASVGLAPDAAGSSETTTATACLDPLGDSARAA
jgi:signal transduction histidine kinase